MPLRERNALLNAAGFAAHLSHTALSSPTFDTVRGASTRSSPAHEPFPAIVIDRRWNLVSSNSATLVLVEGIDPTLLEPPANVLRIAVQLVVPVAPARLWDVLTNPDAVAGWFGARVEWDLHPGGQAHFRQDEGPDRRGRVDTVSPGRHLVFRWWPDGDEEQASEVSYRLEPDADGTRLTVTERPVPADPAPVRNAAAPPASACARSGRSAESAGWSDWDSRLLGMWARAAGPALVGAGGPASRW